MIAFLLFEAFGATPGVRRLTAETLPAGEGIVRLPTGVSAVGVTHRDELWLQPHDLNIGGPRLGMEHSFAPLPNPAD